MSIVHPIDRAWITTGGTGAQNYDEFATDREITDVIAADPASALAVEMPHCAPEHRGGPFAAALPAARERLRRAKAQGRYVPAERVVVLYRISGAGGATYGMFGMVDTDQISTGPHEPGLVIRNEDVFPAKVRERVALTEATGHLLSAILLLQSARGDDLQAALRAAVDAAGAPAARDVDQHGRVHEIWPLPAGGTADRLCELAGSGELVVADGNHRTLAAQTGGLARFLAVVTAPASVGIAPYNRLFTELPHPPGAALRAEPVPGPPELPPPRGTVYLYRDGAFSSLRLPTDPHAPLVDNLDHAVVERWLVRDAFGLDPDDKRVVYVGGDYPVAWLRGEVDAGRAEAALVIAPVTTDDFIAVNLARQKMPRKSTWFTPKVRAGLVLAQLS
jgi:uncharacterized protein (DUF1015 family)